MHLFNFRKGTLRPIRNLGEFKNLWIVLSKFKCLERNSLVLNVSGICLKLTMMEHIFGQLSARTFKKKSV